MKLTRSMLKGLSPDVIREALALRARVARVERLAARRQKLMLALSAIETEMAKLDGSPVRMGHGRPRKSVEPVKRERRRFSVATRRKMAASQAARWAKKRQAEKAVELVKRGNAIQEAANAGS